VGLRARNHEPFALYTKRLAAGLPASSAMFLDGKEVMKVLDAGSDLAVAKQKPLLPHCTPGIAL
jgi:hypothetical protein